MGQPDVNDDAVQGVTLTAVLLCFSEHEGHVNVVIHVEFV